MNTYSSIGWREPLRCSHPDRTNYCNVGCHSERSIIEDNSRFSNPFPSHEAYPLYRAMLPSPFLATISSTSVSQSAQQSNVVLQDAIFTIDAAKRHPRSVTAFFVVYTLFLARLAAGLNLYCCACRQRRRQQQHCPNQSRPVISAFRPHQWRSSPHQHPSSPSLYQACRGVLLPVNYNLPPCLFPGFSSNVAAFHLTRPQKDGC